MSAPKSPSAAEMFGETAADDADDADNDEASGDEDLRVLGEAALEAQRSGDGLAFAKAIRDILGDKDEGDDEAGEPGV